MTTTSVNSKEFFRTIFETDDLALFQEHQVQIEATYFHSHLSSDLRKELLRYAAVNILRFLSVKEDQAKSYINKTVNYIVDEREVTDKRREMMQYLCSQCNATEQLTDYFAFFFNPKKEYLLRFLIELDAQLSGEQLAILEKTDAQLYERLFTEDV